MQHLTEKRTYCNSCQHWSGLLIVKPVVNRFQEAHIYERIYWTECPNANYKLVLRRYFISLDTEGSNRSNLNADILGEHHI